MNDDELNSMQGQIQALSSTLTALMISLRPERAEVSAEVLLNSLTEEKAQDEEANEHPSLMRAKYLIMEANIGLLQTIAANA